MTTATATKTSRPTVARHYHWTGMTRWVCIHPKCDGTHHVWVCAH